MKLRMRSIAPAFLAGVLILMSADHAPGQGGLAVYAPIAPEYRLGDFRYEAPRDDGWRQVASNPGMFILVYAESLPPDQILTRLTVIAEAHEIPADQRERIEGGRWLAGQSFNQQKTEREGRIVAYSPIQAVGDNDVHKYTLVSTGPEGKDSFETFYLKLASDKSSYWIAKFVTSESDFQEQVYLPQFEASLSSLKVEGSAASGEQPGAEGDATGGEDSD
jgi:hypothetical protein